MVIPPAVLLLLRIVFPILCFVLFCFVLFFFFFLAFQMNLRFALSMSLNNCVGILMVIALNLQIAFGRMTIFTILILPTYKHWSSLNFLRPSSISFFRNIKLLSYKSFTCLVRVTPRYFILFMAIVKGIVSLIFSQYAYHLFKEKLLIYLS